MPGRSAGLRALVKASTATAEQQLHTMEWGHSVLLVSHQIVSNVVIKQTVDTGS